MPIGIAELGAIWLAKKFTVLIGARIYGFPAAYRRTLLLSRRWLPLSQPHGLPERGLRVVFRGAGRFGAALEDGTKRILLDAERRGLL